LLRQRLAAIIFIHPDADTACILLYSFNEIRRALCRISHSWTAQLSHMAEIRVIRVKNPLARACQDKKSACMSWQADFCFMR